MFLSTENLPSHKCNSTPTLLTPPSPFNLNFSLTCGQIFGWKRIGQGFLGIIQNDLFFLEQKGDTLTVLNLDKGDVKSEKEIQSKLSHFFRWDDDLAQIVKSWEKDRFLLKIISTFPGLRMIRQDPWECLVRFILSICSNIPKIERTLMQLSQYSGSAILVQHHSADNRNTSSYLIPLIPLPEVIASMKLEALREIGMGFRAAYLKESARRILEGFSLNFLRLEPYDSAKKKLMEFSGIGEKVADCILLFSLDHLEAFPVDVWMQKVLTKYYFRGKTKTPKYLSEWGRNHFGNCAGYAQQYLYHFARNSKGR
jgi:N-glycosylase/DNA lyase